jgi:hypothetical protein
MGTRPQISGHDLSSWPEEATTDAQRSGEPALSEVEWGPAGSLT